MSIGYQTDDGAIHDSEDAARDHNRWRQSMSPENQKRMGKALVAVIFILGPIYYIPQLVVSVLRDYGIIISFWTAFFVVGVPLIAWSVWAFIRFWFNGKGLIMFIIMALIMVPCGFLGFFKVLIGPDYLYNQYVSAMTTRFADGKNIYITAPQASIRTHVSADSPIISNPKKGASMMLVGEGDSGQLLVRYRKDGGNLAWGWIDADKTSYKNNSGLKGFIPATILSDTLNLRLYQKPGSRKIATVGNTLNAAVIRPKKGKEYALLYAWNNDTFYRYSGYAPIGSLFLHDGSGTTAPAIPPPPEGTKATLTANTFMYDKPHWEPGNDREAAINIYDFSAKELKKGDTVILLGDKNKGSWRRIWFDGEYGWLHETINYRADDWLTRPLENLLVIEK